MGRLGLGGVALRCVRAPEAEMRQRTDRVVEHNSAMVPLVLSSAVVRENMGLALMREQGSG
jgi:hypothetical protein